MEEIKEQLAYREANQEQVKAFQVTRTLGDGTKVLLDKDNGKFIVTSARNWREANPDVMRFSDVTGCQLDIEEERTEIKYKDKEGNQQSFNPRCYAYSYDFYIEISVNNPYFSEIRFKLNSSSVDNDEETLLDGPDAAPRSRMGRIGIGSPRTSNADEVRASVEYRQYEMIGQEIRDALLQVRQEARDSAAAPKMEVTCPYCGATTTPDSSGRCEFCGGSVNGQP